MNDQNVPAPVTTGTDLDGIESRDPNSLSAKIGDYRRKLVHEQVDPEVRDTLVIEFHRRLLNDNPAAAGSAWKIPL